MYILWIYNLYDQLKQLTGSQGFYIHNKFYKLSLPKSDIIRLY